MKQRVGIRGRQISTVAEEGGWGGGLMLQGHRKVNQSAHRVITMTENFPEAPPPLTQLWWTGAQEMKASLRRGVGGHLQSATCSEQINKPRKEKKKKKKRQTKTRRRTRVSARPKADSRLWKERCPRGTLCNPLEQFITGVTLSASLGFDVVDNFSKVQIAVNNIFNFGKQLWDCTVS